MPNTGIATKYHNMKPSNSLALRANQRDPKTHESTAKEKSHFKQFCKRKGMSEVNNEDGSKAGKAKAWGHVKLDALGHTAAIWGDEERMNVPMYMAWMTRNPDLNSFEAGRAFKVQICNMETKMG